MKYILNQGGTIEFFSPSSGNVVTIKEDGKVYINGIGGYDGTSTESASTIQEESVFEKGTGANSAQQKGTGAVASGDGSVAEGSGTTASGNYSHAEGRGTTANGRNSHAEGSNTRASGAYSHAEGAFARASGGFSHAEGRSSHASGLDSHAEGAGNRIGCSFTVDGAANATTYTTNQDHNLNVGQVIEYDDTYSRIESVPGLTSFTVDHTLSSRALSAATITIITGIAYGNSSHAEGGYARAIGDYSHAEGQSTVASGADSHAEGTHTLANGVCSHAEGSGTTAHGNCSHAEGCNTAASGMFSHAEGSGTTVSAMVSHAEGGRTTASGAYSHAEGSYTTASGNHSHAEGYDTTASGNYSHAEGLFNFPDTNFIHMVGIGDSESNRLNAHTITEGGLHYILGIGGYSGQDTNGAKDLATVVSGLSIESLTELDYDVIYGKVTVSDIGIIAFDDYPENKIEEILEQYDCQSLGELAAYAKSDPGCTGENWLTNTGNYLEYDGVTYELWRGHAGAVGSSPVLGLLPIGTTYAQLRPLSIEVDESSKYCPFAAMCFNGSSSTDWGDGTVYESNGEAFSLLYVTQKQ